MHSSMTPRFSILASPNAARNRANRGCGREFLLSREELYTRGWTDEMIDGMLAPKASHFYRSAVLEVESTPEFREAIFAQVVKMPIAFLLVSTPAEIECRFPSDKLALEALDWIAKRRCPGCTVGGE